MKKILLTCLLFISLFVITGCGPTKSEDSNTNAGSNANSESGENKGQNMKKVNVSLTYMGTDITPGKTFNAKSISKTATKSTLPSCALEGEDNVYTYDNIEITANVSGKTETIFSVYFIDETVSTNEGIKIGDTKKKLVETYGDNYIDDETLITYVDETSKRQINFQIEDGIVSGIEYVQTLN